MTFTFTAMNSPQIQFDTDVITLHYISLPSVKNTLLYTVCIVHVIAYSYTGLYCLKILYYIGYMLVLCIVTE